MNSERKYDRKKELPYCAHGEIIEDGENYDVVYGANNIYITEDDIRRIIDGAMFYYTDGEYAYCLVYKKNDKPLIKDEKIRKAVRAWAEALGQREQFLCIKSGTRLEISDGSPHLLYISFWADKLTLDSIDDRTYCTIAELCGEEGE